MDKNTKNDEKVIPTKYFKYINPVEIKPIEDYFSDLPNITLPEINISNNLDSIIKSFQNFKEYSYFVSLPWEDSNIFPKSETKKKNPEAFLKKICKFLCKSYF